MKTKTEQIESLEFIHYMAVLTGPIYIFECSLSNTLSLIQNKRAGAWVLQFFKHGNIFSFLECFFSTPDGVPTPLNSKEPMNAKCLI